MECRKCKAELSEGETFCRRCATSIYVDDDLELDNKTSNKKKSIVNINKLKDITPKIKQKESNTSFNNESYIPGAISNKDLVNRNQNNIKAAQRSLAKSLIIIFSILSLLIITIVLMIILL